MSAVRSDRPRRPLVAIGRLVLPWAIAAAVLGLIVLVGTHQWLLVIVIPALWYAAWRLFFRR